MSCRRRAASGASIARPSTVTGTVFAALAQFSPAAVKVQSGPALSRPVVLDTILEFDQTVEHGLGPRRASRDIQMYRHDAVDTLQHRVIIVGTARTRACAERHHPFRLAHLLVDAAQNRRLALCDGADHEEQVGLSRREPRQRSAETVDLVTRTLHLDTFHSAAPGH